MDRYFHIQPGGDIPKLASENPYRAVLILEATCDPAWQAQVSRELCESGCRFMMAWGIECGSWDDSVDWANIEQFEPARIPEQGFVLTTWHDDESLDEVFEFARIAAFHPHVELQSTTIIQIGGEARGAETMARYEDA